MREKGFVGRDLLVGRDEVPVKVSSSVFLFNLDLTLVWLPNSQLPLDIQGNLPPGKR